MPTYTQDELDHFCRSPHDRLRDAARTGTADDIARCFTRLTGLVRDIAALYGRWLVATTSWVTQEHGLDAAAELAIYTEQWPADAPTLDADQLAVVRSLLRGDDDAADLEKRVHAAADEQGVDAVLALWDDVHAACARAESIRRDAVTAVLSTVVRRYGAQGLEQCLRHATELIWAPRMSADLACAPADRVRNWAEKMAVGHGGSVRVTELDDRWVITLDPCGSCGRQILADRYRPPWDFAMAPPGSPVAFLRDDITVYQAHLAVAHGIVPIEQTGAPWPAISCAGLAARPCTLTIFRDPADTDESYYTQVGLTRAPTRRRR